MQITEDEIYRSSSQFRLWSFTPDQLAAQRAETNKVAATRVKAAVQRQRAQRAKEGERSSVTGSESEINGSGVENGNGTVPEKEVDCLTVAEEQKLVNTFCERAIDLGNFFKFPIEVVVCFWTYSFAHLLYFENPAHHDSRPPASNFSNDSTSSTPP